MISLRLFTKSNQLRARYFASVVSLFFGCTISIAQVNEEVKSSDWIQEQIENIIRGQLFIAGEKILEPDWVTEFYQSNNYQVGWNDRLNVAMMLALLQRASDEGLNPQEYHLDELNLYYEQLQLPDKSKVYFDLLLTDAFMAYGSDLRWGKTDPSILYADEWQFEKQEIDLVLILEFALSEKSLARAIDYLSPQLISYKKLKESLQFYRKVKLTGGWQSIPNGDAIDSGMIDFRIPLIRERLRATSQLFSDNVTDSLVYDSTLVESIRKFQWQYGLAVDGVIGDNTVASLNLSPDDHIRKIEANLERYRWLHQNPGEKFLWVNVPSFQLEVYSNDSLIMKMKAIVGKPDRRTPVLQSDIHYLILNPTWTVPPTILREDVLPAVNRNIKYLSRNNLRVINRDGVEINPIGLPWSTYTEKNFPYQLRQDPGPNNSLGLMKFQFPNNHRVFLHDTNHPNLFSLTNRALSSGCIRIEHPLALATYLLKGTSWTERQIEKKIESEKTSTIMFAQPVPISVVYFTAFVDKQNMFHMMNDIYGWDDRLLSALSDVHIQ